MVENYIYLKQHIGVKVKEYRLKIGLSQETLAFRSGLHRTYIGVIERGEKDISVKCLFQISQALNIDICCLFK